MYLFISSFLCSYKFLHLSDLSKSCLCSRSSAFSPHSKTFAKSFKSSCHGKITSSVSVRATSRIASIHSTCNHAVISSVGVRLRKIWLSLSVYHFTPLSSSRDDNSLRISIFPSESINETLLIFAIHGT